MKEKVGKWLKENLIFLIACVVAIIFLFGVRGRFIVADKLEFNTTDENSIEVNLLEGDVSQYFEIDKKMQSVAVLVENHSPKAAKLEVRLINASSGEVYAKDEKVLEVSETMQAIGVDASTQNVDEHSPVCIQLHSDDDIAVMATQGQYDERMMQGDIELQARVRMSVNYELVYMKTFWVLTLFLAVGVLFVFFYQRENQKEPYIVFALLATTAGIFFSFVNPLAQECDGWTHFVRALDVSYGNVIAPIATPTHESGQLIVPENIFEVGYQIVQPGAGMGMGYNENLKARQFMAQTMVIEGSDGFASIYYWPQGLGLAIGRVLHFNIYACVVLAHLLNLFVYIAITAYAIKLIPVYKNVLAAVALLPISIYQAASFSPDSLLNALCFLFVALVFYYVYEKDIELSWKQMLPLGVIILLIFMCKYIYAAIGILVFLIPIKRFRSGKEYAKTFAIAIAPLVILGGLLFVKGMFGGNASSAADAAVATEMTQLQYVMHNPIQLVKVLINTAFTQFSAYAIWLNTLGTLNYSLDLLIYIVPCVLSVIAFLDVNEISARISRNNKWICLITFGVSVVAVWLGLYLFDNVANPVGSNVVLGAQGRYFVPLLPVLAVFLNSSKVSNNISRFTEKALGCMGVILLYSAYTFMSMCY